MSHGWPEPTWAMAFISSHHPYVIRIIALRRQSSTHPATLRTPSPHPLHPSLEAHRAALTCTAGYGIGGQNLRVWEAATLRGSESFRVHPLVRLVSWGHAKGPCTTTPMVVKALGNCQSRLLSGILFLLFGFLGSDFIATSTSYTAILE